MEHIENSSLVSIEQAIKFAATDIQAKEWISEFALPFQKLMSYYQCAAVCFELDQRMEKLNTKLHRKK